MHKSVSSHTLESHGSNVDVAFHQAFPLLKNIWVFPVFYIINPRLLCLVVKPLSNLAPPYPLNNIVFEFPMCTL